MRQLPGRRVQGLGNVASKLSGIASGHLQSVESQHECSVEISTPYLNFLSIINFIIGLVIRLNIEGCKACLWKCLVCMLNVLSGSPTMACDSQNYV
jgi:hypothetical protein